MVRVILVVYTGEHRTGRWRRWRWLVGLLLAIPLALLGIATQTAAAANVVNVTFHVSSSVKPNPCYPADMVNFSGDIHIVMATTADGAGGYHAKYHLNTQLSGVSITTGTKYVNSEDQEDEWYAGAPFPVVHTHTYDLLFVSQSNTDNFVMHVTMHETVNAQGVPTATVDQFSMDCQG